MKLLEVQDLEKRFDGFHAIAGVNLVFESNEICAIIGPNGAGKTTFFNLITGRHKVSKGRILFQGSDITNLQPHRIVQQGLGRSFQIQNIFRGLTVLQNVRTAVLAHSKKTMKLFADTDRMHDIGSKTKEILRTIGLDMYADRMAGVLSHGDQKRLEIAIALANKPTLLLLDEPTAGMNPEETEQMVHLVQSVALKNQVTILFTEHDMGIVFSISQRIVVLQQGRVLADGKPEDIKQNQDVKTAYLGEEIWF